MSTTPELKTNYPSCQVVYIYGLVCPLLNIVRYVGKSVDPSNRYKQHIFRLKKGEGKYKMNWIKSLKNQNLKPELTIIGCFDAEEIDKKEEYYINFYSQELKEKGLEKGLTNLDFGLYSVSEETKLAQRKSFVKQNQTIGVKKRKNIWEVYLNLDNTRYFLGNYKSKILAQRVYDAVIKNYRPEDQWVLNFPESTSPLRMTVEQAQEFSNKLSRKRNNWTEYPGIYKLTGKNEGKWDVNIKINNKWVRVGRTIDLEKGIEIRDRVALTYGLKLLKEEHRNLSPLTEIEGKQLLTGKKHKYIGLQIDNYGIYRINFVKPKERQRHYIGGTKNEKLAVYLYDCLANYYNKKSNHTTTDKLSIEQAKEFILKNGKI